MKTQWTDTWILAQDKIICWLCNVYYEFTKFSICKEFVYVIPNYGYRTWRGEWHRTVVLRGTLLPLLGVWPVLAWMSDKPCVFGVTDVKCTWWWWNRYININIRRTKDKMSGPVNVLCFKWECDNTWIVVACVGDVVTRAGDRWSLWHVLHLAMDFLLVAHGTQSFFGGVAVETAPGLAHWNCLRVHFRISTVSVHHRMRSR